MRRKSQPERRHFWEQHVKALSGSQLSRARYCREHDLSYSTLSYWCQRLKGELSTGSSKKLVPVNNQSRQQPRADLVEIVLPDQTVMRCRAGCEPEWMADLLNRMRGQRIGKITG